MQLIVRRTCQSRFHCKGCARHGRPTVHGANVSNLRVLEPRACARGEFFFTTCALLGMRTKALMSRDCVLALKCLSYRCRAAMHLCSFGWRHVDSHKEKVMNRDSRLTMIRFPSSPHSRRITGRAKLWKTSLLLIFCFRLFWYRRSPHLQWRSGRHYIMPTTVWQNGS